MSISPETHFRMQSGPYRARFLPHEVTQLVDYIGDEPLFRYDLEELVAAAAEQFLRLPPTTIWGKAHFCRDSRPVDSVSAALRLAVHVPLTTWPAFDERITASILAQFGSWSTGARCTCLPGAGPVAETAIEVIPADGVEASRRDLMVQVLAEIQRSLDVLMADLWKEAEEVRRETLIELRRQLQDRQDFLVEFSEAHKELGIALTLAPEDERVTLSPKELTVETFTARAADAEPLPALVAEAREGVIRTIVGFAEALERTPKTAQRLAALDEEAVRDVLLFVLNANWRGQAVGEMFSWSGKTDISIMASGRRLFMAELKWWDGSKALAEAVDQLSGYLVARETAACLVILYKGGNFTSVADKAHAALLGHSAIVGCLSPLSGSGNTGRYWLKSATDSTRRLELVVILVDLSMR